MAGSASVIEALLECKSLEHTAGSENLRWKVDEKLAEDHGRVTPLYLAAQRGNTEVVEALLKAGAKVNVKLASD